jgi:voltage-gated potassium channel
MPQSADAYAPQRIHYSGRTVSQRRSQVRDAAVAGLLILAAGAVYFLLPVPGKMQKTSWEILFACGVVVLGCLIVLAIRRLMRAGEDVRVRGLVLLLCLTVLFFSYFDVSLAALPGQFADLNTKVDSLYFNISTLATVGFGDVHAAGQLARVAVTVQVVFNLVFLGTAVGIISGMLRARANRRLAESGQGEGRKGPL